MQTIHIQSGTMNECSCLAPKIDKHCEKHHKKADIVPSWPDFRQANMETDDLTPINRSESRYKNVETWAETWSNQINRPPSQTSADHQF